MKNKIFTKSIRIFITALLITTALVSRKDLSQKIMIALCAVWLIINIGPFIWILLKKLISKINFLITEFSATEELLVPELPAPGPPDNEPAPETLPPSNQPSETPPVILSTGPEAVPPPPALSEHDESIMLQHIALRLSDKLKSAYPKATWQWLSPPLLSSVFRGNTIRISVDNMDQYTHADILFDRYGRIHIEPMIVGSFKPVTPTDDLTDASAEELPPDKPDIVDVGIWYQLIGQKILDKTITELNAGGHSRLTIKENGDIIILRQKKEVVQDTLESFPPKQYWDELIELLEEYQLTAKNLNDKIIISWI